MTAETRVLYCCLLLKEPVQPSKRLTVCIDEDTARQSLFQDSDYSALGLEPCAG